MVNVKLSASQLNELKQTTKNATDVTLGLSSNIFGDDDTNFPRKLLLTDRQIMGFCKTFGNKSSVNIKCSKTLLSKLTESGAFLGRILGLLLKAGLSFTKNGLLQTRLEDVVKTYQTYLLTGDTFMPEKHLRQHRFTFSTTGQFTTNKTRIQKFREKIESRYTYRN